MKTDFFQTPFFLSITIGIPFCIYKILFGILAMRVGDQIDCLFLIYCGVIITVWASVDLFMNTARALFFLIGKSSFIEYCTLAQLGRLCNASAVFLALDTLITFSIICFVLWSGWIMHLFGIEPYLWYFATTLNLISLSVVGLWTELVRLREHRRT